MSYHFVNIFTSPVRYAHTHIPLAPQDSLVAEWEYPTECNECRVILFPSASGRNRGLHVRKQTVRSECEARFMSFLI